MKKPKPPANSTGVKPRRRTVNERLSKLEARVGRLERQDRVIAGFGSVECHGEEVEQTKDE